MKTNKIFPPFYRNKNLKKIKKIKSKNLTKKIF